MLNLASGVYGKGFGYWAARYRQGAGGNRGRPTTRRSIPLPWRRCCKRARKSRSSRVCHHDTPSGTSIRSTRDRAHCRRTWRLSDRRCRLLLRRHGHSSRGLPCGYLRHRPEQVPRPPAGLTLSASAPRAWAKMKANPAAPRASMLSILDWENAWSHDKPFPFTPSVAEINGLDAALDLYLDEGPESRLGAPCADGERLPRRRPGDGPGAVGGARGDRLADRRPRCKVPDGNRRAGAAGRGPRALRRRFLVRARRNPRQAGPHRPYGADRHSRSTRLPRWRRSAAR